MRPKLFLIVRTVSALAASIGAGAAQLNKIPRTGFLMVGFPPPESAPLNENLKAFHKGLLELGYVEGKNIIIEHQYTKGGSDRLPELTEELVRLKVDAIESPGSSRRFKCSRKPVTRHSGRQ
jgi:putative ABC transport system substrate-binding protein